MRRLIVGIVATIAVYGLFYLHPQKASPAQDWRDDVWLWLIAGTFTLAALVMLLPSIPWTWRGVGLFLTSLGAAALYGGVLWTRRDDPSGDLPETWADLIRALYVVGGLLLLYGLLDWLGVWWRDRQRPTRSPDDLDRSGVGAAEQDAGASDNLRRSVRCAAQVIVAGVVNELLERHGVYNAKGWWEVIVVAGYAGTSNMVWNTVEDGLGVRFLGPLDHRLGDAVIAADTTHPTVHPRRRASDWTDNG